MTTKGQVDTCQLCLPGEWREHELCCFFLKVSSPVKGSKGMLVKATVGDPLS